MAINPAEHPFSRRAFLAGAGAIAANFAAPLVAGQRVPEPFNAFVPQAAYADDAPTFKFATVRPYEVSCKVLDVTEANNHRAVPNVTVSLTNVFDASRIYSQVTGEEGDTIYDVRYFMKGFDPATKTFAKDCGPKQGVYSADASVSLRADGYRQVDINKTNIIGGGGLGLPICRITDENRDVPYFRSVSLNDYDILYTTGTFLYSAANDAQHELAAELYLKSVASATVSFWRWRSESSIFPGISDNDSKNKKNGLVLLGSLDASISDEEVANRKRLDAEDEQAMAAGRTYDKAAYDDRWIRKVSLSERFLQTNFDRGFNAGDRILVRVKTDSASYVYLMNAKFKNAPLDKVDAGTWNAIPGFGGQDLNFTLPDAIPGIGGTTFEASWLPSFPVVFEVSPLGYMMIGFTLYSSEVDNESPFKKDNWKKTEYEKAKKQCEEHSAKSDKLVDNYKTMRDNWKQGGQNGNPTKRFQAETFKKFEASFAVQAMANLDYGDLDGTMRGRLNLMLEVSGAGKFGWNMLVGPVPVYLGFYPSARLTFATGVGLVSTWPSGDQDWTDKALQFFSEMNYSWKDTQVALVLGIKIGVEAGVGIAGAVSVGVRGSAAFTGYLGLYEGAGHGTDTTFPYPHARVGIGLDVSVAVQIFLFKASKKLWGIQWPTLYDSWGIKAQAAAFGAGDDGIPTETGLPDEFKLKTARVMGMGDEDDGYAIDPNNFVISLEEMAQEGVGVTDSELAASSEFGVTAKVQTASFGAAEDELELVAQYAPAGGDSNVPSYDLVLVSADGNVAVAQDDNESEQAKAADATDSATVATNEEASAEESSVDADAEQTGTNDANVDQASENSPVVATAAGVAAFANNEDDENDATDDAMSSDEQLYDDFGNPLDFDDDNYIDGFDVKVSGGHATGSGADSSTAGVASVTGEGALTPSADTAFLKDVFSDGRVRVMKINGVSIMLRIASGEFSGRHRTCLVYQTRDSGTWSEPNVVSFGIDGLGGITRFDLYDYDFDVCQMGSNAIAIALLSGQRPDGDDTTMLQACTNPVTSVIVMTTIYHTPIVSLARSWRSFDGGASLGEDGQRYLTYAPCISYATGSSSSTNTFPRYISGAFIYKRAAGDDVLKDSTPAHIAGFCLRALCQIQPTPYGDRYNWALTSAKTFDMPGAPDTVSALSIGSTTSGGRVSFKLGYESQKGCGFFEAAFGYSYNSETRRGSLSVSASKGAHYDYIKKLYRTQRAQYLGVDTDDVLCELRDGGFVTVGPYDARTGADDSQEIVSEIPAAFGLSADRSLLVWAENKEGVDGFDYSDAGQNGAPQPTYEDGRYRIMASRAVTNGGITLYTKPFVLCEIGYPIDSIAAVTCDNSAMRIIVSNITDLASSTCDYHEIVLPITVLATPVAMTAPIGALVPGETCDMQVTLRNDGNTQLSGITFAINEVNEAGAVISQVGSVDVEFGPDSIISGLGAKANPDDSLADPVFDSGFHNAYSAAASGVTTQASDGMPFDADAFAAHSLVAGDGRNFLTPDSQAVVAVPLVIPENWTGEKTLNVTVKALKFVNPVNGEIVSVDGPGTTASINNDGDSKGKVAGLTAIGEEVIGAAASSFAEDTKAEITLSENVGDDDYGASMLSAAHLIQKGDDVNPDDDPGADNPGGESGSGGTSGGSGSGSHGEGSGSSNNANAGGDSGNEANGVSGKGTLPALGDSSASFGAVGAVAALAGAGLMAYSRRRVQIESEAAASVNGNAEAEERE